MSLSTFLLDEIHEKVIAELLIEVFEDTCPEQWDYLREFKNNCDGGSCDACWLRALLQKKAGEI